MHEVAIHEPLHKVYALFERSSEEGGEKGNKAGTRSSARINAGIGGRIVPVAVEWGQRKIKVARVNSSWVDRSLRPHRYGFSLTMETGEIFQVSYEEGNPVWKLEYILTD